MMGPMGSNDAARGEASGQKRKGASPFISYTSFSNGPSDPSAKRQAGTHSLGGTSNKTAGGSSPSPQESRIPFMNMDRFPTPPPPVGDKDEQAAHEACVWEQASAYSHKLDSSESHGMMSPPMNMLSCGSMSAFALGVAAGNGSRLSAGNDAQHSKGDCLAEARGHPQHTHTNNLLPHTNIIEQAVNTVES